MEYKISETSEYEKFMQQKHESFNTPNDIIIDAVKRATGSLIVKQRRIIGGETNEVYSATLFNGKKVIIRIYHGHKSRFPKEQWAMAACAKVNVPVPEIVYVESFYRENEPIHVCIESNIEGIALGDLAGRDICNSTLSIRAILAELGNILQRLHSIEISGFGCIDNDGKGVYKSVYESLTRDLEISLDAHLSNAANLSIDINVVIRAKNRLADDALKLNWLSPRLVHGDLSPKHILVNEGKISALIDFENAKGSDPAEEFARWELKFGKEFSVEAILGGYGDKDVTGIDFEMRKGTWKLYQSLTSLCYCIKHKKQFGIHKATKQLKETLSETRN